MFDWSYWSKFWGKFYFLAVLWTFSHYFERVALVLWIYLLSLKVLRYIKYKVIWFKYISYILLELLDTFLQMIAGKTPPNYFLHVYHHSLVIFMSWVWLESSASMQFIGLLFNTAVHVVMYYYYFLRSIGIIPKWKSIVTKFQIIQFVTSVVCFLITILFAINRHLTDSTQCRGLPIVLGSMIFNITLLYGFVGILSKDSKSKKSSWS